MSKQCGQKCIVMSRVCGFYSNLHEWNPGKQEEFKMRKTYTLPFLTEEDVKSAVSTEEKEMLHNESVFALAP